MFVGRFFYVRNEFIQLSNKTVIIIWHKILNVGLYKMIKFFFLSVILILSLIPTAFAENAGTITYIGECHKALIKKEDVTSRCGKKLTKLDKGDHKNTFMAFDDQNDLLLTLETVLHHHTLEYLLENYTTDNSEGIPLNGKCTERRLPEKGAREFNCHASDPDGNKFEYIFEGVEADSK